jgi:crotonobetainyl-CoA:carnitine CoA-transferase CaiB-like acyl-CoA transferase
MLEGTRVLSFTHYLQGPSASQILGDLGADVIKVERPAGAWERSWAGADAFVGGESVFFLAAGRNQRNIAVNLRHEDGRRVLRRLARDVDVLIENYRPGVLDKYGLGYDELRQDNPRLVYCSLTGFGSDGPRRDDPGQDLLLQAISGLASITGRADDPPTPAGTSVVDQHGAVLGALGVLAALVKAQRTGQGTYVRGNLLDSALDLQIESLAYHLNGERLHPRSAAGVATPFHPAPYGVFAASDGYLCLSLVSLDQLAEIFADPGLAGFDPNDAADRETLTRLVAQRIAEGTVAEWLERFAGHGIWSTPVNDYRALERDPQLAHNKSIISFDHPSAGPVRVVGHPLTYDGQRPSVRRVPPALGQDTVDVLRELGLGPDECRELLASGALSAPDTNQPA